MGIWRCAWLWVWLWVLSVAMGPMLLQAGPMTADQAREAAHGWLQMNSAPMDTVMPTIIKGVDVYVNQAEGSPAYYVVKLSPQGFVVVAADDEIEPICAFSPRGRYEPLPDNPLFALVEGDLSMRVAGVRSADAAHKDAKISRRYHSRWNSMRAASSDMTMGSETRSSSISDVRIAPLIQSRWSQTTESGMNCYNYYTPYQYPCGCVATAMAQVMRFHQHPALGIGVNSCIVYVDSSQRVLQTRGGDGLGGSYDWSLMVLDPDGSITELQRQAIGALCYDAGLAVQMEYSSWGSGADALDCKEALVGMFGYSNAVRGYNASKCIQSQDLVAMLNPNLDYGYPVLLGISGDSGHAIVCDGYGYDQGTMYHHLNLGWAGSSDAWYNLPLIDTTNATFTSVYKCIYNIFTSGSGEIISGRVLDKSGSPLANVVLVAQDGRSTYNAETNSKGLYVFGSVPSNTKFTITTLVGGTTRRKVVSTGRSANNESRPGNLWGVDFAPLRPPVASDVEITVSHAEVPATITMEATDDGEPNSILTYRVTRLPAHGALADPLAGDITAVPYTLVKDGNHVWYTPDPCFGGVDSFAFVADDGGVSPDGGTSNTAVATITVLGPPPAPFYVTPGNAASGVDLKSDLRWNPAPATVLINEVDLGYMDAIELFNTATFDVDMSGWKVVCETPRESPVVLNIKDFILPAGGYAVLTEGVGANTPVMLHFDTNIWWLDTAAGSCALVDQQGKGIDFVRWTDNRGVSVSLAEPPAGTSWLGHDPFAPADAEIHSLARDGISTDTDSGADWDNTSGIAAASKTLGSANDTIRSRMMVSDQESHDRPDPDLLGSPRDSAGDLIGVQSENVGIRLSEAQAVASINARACHRMSQTTEHCDGHVGDSELAGQVSGSASIAYSDKATGGLDVAIVAAATSDGITSGQFTDPRDKLLATGRFKSVAVIDAGVVTPTLSELEAFDSVLVWSNASFADSTAFGDALADYVDGGGGVVVAVFAVCGPDSDRFLSGRFDADNYHCIVPRSGNFSYSSASLGTIRVPNHPLMKDVESFGGGDSSYRPNGTALVPDAVLVAEWSDGRPLVVARDIDGIRRVDLGFYPVSDSVRSDFWDSSTDGDVMMANALEYAAGTGSTARYDVYLGTDNPPTTKIIGDTIETSCQPDLLQFDTTYYWQVVAKTSAGQTAGPIWSFSTICRQTPVLLPENIKVNGTCTSVSWAPVVMGVRYQVECATDKDFADVVAVSGWITDTHHDFCDIETDVEHWWRVKAKLGYAGQWQQSSQAEFEQNTLVSVSTVTSPDDMMLARRGAAAFLTDDFEDGDWSGWQLDSTGTDVSVTSQTAASGRYSLSISTRSSGYFEGLSHALDSVRPNEASLYVRSASTSLAGACCVLGSGKSEDTTAVMFVMGFEGGMGIFDRNNYWGEAFVAYTWYYVRFVFDWAKKEVDYYVDGRLIKADIPFFSSSVDTLTNVSLFNLDPTQAWYDRIAIGSVSVPVGSGYAYWGTAVSPPVVPISGGVWDSLSVNGAVPDKTLLSVDVLDAQTGDILLQDVSPGDDLSALVDAQVKLQLNLVTLDSLISPALHDWSLLSVQIVGESLWSDPVRH